MSTNCEIKITKFVTAFLLICFVAPAFASDTKVDLERSKLSQDIATTIQKAGAFGKVTVFGQDRTDGWALIDFTAEDEKDHRVFFIAGDFECLSQITPDLSDVELLCLNGDDFVGKVTAENEESTRVKGTFKNSGDARIILNGFQISGVEELIKRLNPTEYDTITLLRDYSPQEPVSEIVVKNQTSTDNPADLEKFISQTISNTNAFGKLTLFSNKKLNGKVFLNLDLVDRSAPLNAVFILDGTSCGITVGAFETEVEFSCLDGDFFSGKIKNTDDGARINGKFQKRGKAKLVISGIDRTSYENALTQLNEKEYDLVDSLLNQVHTTSEKIEAAPKILENQNTAPSETPSVKSNQKDKNSIVILIEKSKETCADLGFMEGSDGFANCTLTLLEKNL